MFHKKKGIDYLLLRTEQLRFFFFFLNYSHLSVFISDYFTFFNWKNWANIDQISFGTKVL